MITALTINYNTPDYLERLLTSFRKFYPDLPYLVIDGSDEEYYKPIKNFDKRFNVELLHFNYNIHHGPGMAYGIRRILTEQILLVDSDMIIHNGEWLEMMEVELRKDSYGIGDIQKEYLTTKVSKQKVFCDNSRRRRHNRTTIKVTKEKIYIDYLHPAFALINKDVAMMYPLPVKGGAPLLPAMAKIWKDGRSILLQRAQWLTDDLWDHKCLYVQHNHNHKGMGTVKQTGGYHLE